MRIARRKALVIGGGIGGLTAALALRRGGWAVEVYEQAPELREVGSGLMLSPNALRVLEGLGLTSLRARGVEVTRAELCSWRGRVLSGSHLEDLWARLEAPAVLIPRAALHSALREAFGEDGLHLGARLVRFDDAWNSVMAFFQDERRATGELLVGADGLHSRVRALLHPGEPVRYAGYACWRGISRPFAHEALPVGVLRETQGRGARFGAGYIRESRVYWWATVNLPEGQPVPGGDRRFLQDTFGSAHAPIPELLAATEEVDVLRNDIYDREPVSRWGEGRVTLLGDAAHPMTPNLGQGACAAIEDGAVLTAALEDEVNVERGLRDYEYRRLARTARLQRGSWLFGMVGQWENPVAVWLREQAARRTPPHLMMREWERMWGWRLEQERFRAPRR